MGPPERRLVWFLRFTAAMFLAAAPAVIMPTDWMRAIAEWHDLYFPDWPLVQYLARSMSALYMMMGAGYAFMSLDVRRYLPLLRFSVPATAAFDVTAVILDIAIEMPLAWTLGEAVAIFAWTGALWWLVRRVKE